MSKNNFNFQYVIGRGGFGKVGELVFVTDWAVLVAGLARGVPQDDANLCHEGDVEGAGHRKAVRNLGYEREEASREAAAPLLGQHQLRVPGQGESLSR